MYWYRHKLKRLIQNKADKITEVDATNKSWVIVNVCLLIFHTHILNR